ncbi:MAG: regulatory iron-sulfur-containing complex subunit RicT [Saprospiraceae bacterium]
MGCSSCSVDSKGVPVGCGDKGHCTSGSCNKHNAYDWIAAKDIFDPSAYSIVEVSFKKGAHKDFFINDPYTRCVTGDMVVVESASGYDVGRLSLSGELVRLQMKKKYTSEDRVAQKVIRKANERDLEKLEEARQLEKETMVRARVISRTLGLDMKLGDVEFQGDKKKATFYYTAEGRVDFRELVKEYAREFRVKIEMRQIGARQESARIGGIGSCGRELCCSTWLSDFKSVNTAAARYQNIAINQSKLSGQCGRLKCCLNYELDTYLDALEDFPEDADHLKTRAGNLVLIKTDIFKGLLYYVYENNDKMRGTILAISTTRAKEVRALNIKGVLPNELVSDVVVPNQITDPDDENIDHGYADVTGQIELRQEPKKKKKRPQRKGDQRSGSRNDHRSQGNTNREKQQPKQDRDHRTPDDKNKPGAKQGGNQGTPESNNNVPNNEPRAPKNSPNEGGNKEGSTDANANNTNKKKKRFFNKNRKPKDGSGQ